MVTGAAPHPSPLPTSRARGDGKSPSPRAFVDGNKRVAFLAAALFLSEPDLEITASDEAVVTAVLSLAEGSIDEGSFAAWLQTTQRPAAKRILRGASYRRGRRGRIMTPLDSLEQVGCRNHGLDPPTDRDPRRRCGGLFAPDGCR